MPATTDAERVQAKKRGLAWLLTVQRTDGSWGYRPAGTGYVEPSALSILALLTADASGPEVAQGLRRAVEWLAANQHVDGSWGISPQDPGPSWMTSYAVWALTALGRSAHAGLARPGLDRALEWLLVDVEPEALDEEQLAETRYVGGIDGSLVGWKWVLGDSYWVFPTALAMVAASVAGRRDAGRVAQGAALLKDRVCQGGGWNVGNPYMLDKVFAPTVVDTAVALLALDSVGLEKDPAAEDGRARLRSLLAETSSPLGLAWGALALRGRAGAEDPIERLAASQRSDDSWLGNPFATALAALALTGGPLPGMEARP